MEVNTLRGSIRGMKVDLITLACTMIQLPQKIEDIKITDVQDISAMKVNAISVSGERVKDFTTA